MSVFLDLRKAFDTVSIPILVQKLENLGIRDIPLALLKDYLTDRKQRVKIGEVTSADIEVSYGVPQGSVLGPTLFLIYINQLCELRLENGHIYCYADDTALVFSGGTWDEVRKNAEKGLIMVSDWLRANLLTLNAKKTNYVCYSIYNRYQPHKNFQIHIHECNDVNSSCNCPTIEKVSTVKYLGIMLDQRLSWYPHINLVSDRIKKLTWIFKMLRHIAMKDLLRNIYIALIQPIITYCIPIWGGAAKTEFLVVERAQRSLLKVMNFKSYRFDTNQLYAISEVLSVRKLYILQVILKMHKSLPYDTKILDKRKKRKVEVATQVHARTTFARRQYITLSSHLYNQINNIYKIYPRNIYDCKKTVKKGLLALSYFEIEAFLKYFKC